MKKNDEFEEVYEDVVIENYGIPIVFTDVLVRKHKSTGRNISFIHPDSIQKIKTGQNQAFPISLIGKDQICH